jgi:DGQHR domain-containing protein
VKRHIQDIVEYLNSDNILFPNSLIISFSTEVTFRPLCAREGQSALSVAGVLSIPMPGGKGSKPGWIVDGQQRTVALLQSKRRNWPIPISAFVSDEVELQRDQFLRVNNSKPLPRGLILELLPELTTPLPRDLQPKKIPSELCNLLNRDIASPFHGLIRRASSSPEATHEAVVADASIIKMVEESLTTPSGCLFAYHNLSTGVTDFASVWAILIAYWSAVAEVFPDAWGRPPTESRLMHGTGIRAIGRLMDRVTSGFHPLDPDLQTHLRTELQKIAPMCRWTYGRWEDLELDWNEIQNVPRHLRLLSNLLIRGYLQSRDGAK